MITSYSLKPIVIRGLYPPISRPPIPTEGITEPTGYARSAVVPLLLVVAAATLVARMIEARSIYDPGPNDQQVRDRQRTREQAEPA
jgi:hypothetical protein